MISDSSAVSPADEVVSSLLPVVVGRLLEALEHRDRDLIMLRFGLGGDEPQSLEAVGASLGLSREAVRQAQARALKTLRRVARASPDARELLAG